MTAEPVWWPRAPTVAAGRVAVVTVSYNTRELTAFLLWSLRTIVAWPDLEIVVVDNGSGDGSAQYLAEAARAGVCTLLANDGNRQHGPGLNQGISHLAARPGPHPEWVWVLDSDVVATRPDVLSAAVGTAREHAAALVGEPQHDRWHADGRFGLFSLLIDPAVVWRGSVGPFTDGGDPSSDLLASAARQGIQTAAFPFTADGHVIHRGRGTLAAVHAAGERDHPLYAWAETHHAAHYAEVPGADQRYQALRSRFRKEVSLI
ncbi:glycosyltransferase involved in cell wall biosynthesis [Catenulispora sp. GP43]|uniref:glycosyltransferase family 2 protein n=1 Tax=Catenulispora sp. GP43 TaxID=3156263 RepID=UPI003517BB64